jgi:hypothetical protein
MEIRAQNLYNTRATQERGYLLACYRIAGYAFKT